MKKLALATLLLTAAWTVSAAQQGTATQGNETGLVEGVVESTDQDRIAAIEDHARQLESKKIDNYDAPAAGKRHKAHRHGGTKHMMKKAPDAPDATLAPTPTPVQ